MPKKPDGEGIRSLRLVLTKRVAELCGFEYEESRYPYGGFLDVIELQTIATKLDEYKRLRDRIKSDHPEFKKVLE